MSIISSIFLSIFVPLPVDSSAAAAERVSIARAATRREATAEGAASRRAVDGFVAFLPMSCFLALAAYLLLALAVDL